MSKPKVGRLAHFIKPGEDAGQYAWLRVRDGRYFWHVSQALAQLDAGEVLQAVPRHERALGGLVGWSPTKAS